MKLFGWTIERTSKLDAERTALAKEAAHDAVERLLWVEGYERAVTTKPTGRVFVMRPEWPKPQIWTWDNINPAINIYGLWWKPVT